LSVPFVVGAFPSRDDPELLARLEEPKGFLARVSVVLDDPSLKVCHYGMIIHNPSWLTARDHWFERYWSILETHLRDPRTAEVFTLESGRLTDPFVTHKSSPTGPFPFPRGMSWPTCGLCNARLAFLGVLDCRRVTIAPLPRGSIVLHVCNECGVPGDREAWSVNWIKEGDEIEILGDLERQTLVGKSWHATEYLKPATYAKDLASDGLFPAEHGIYFNFSCFADKVGGHLWWIQGDETPTDSGGRPMTYVGQFVGTDQIEIGDTGLAYLFYSPHTGETVMVTQCF